MINLIINLIREIGNMWSLALLLAAAGTLLWFIYVVVLRKILRARRISHLRSKRLLDEATDRNDL